MKTRQLGRAWICATAICATGWVYAQNDGDHTVTDGSGVTFLDTDAQVGGGAVNPDGFTVGTTPNNNAALVVEGAQMNNSTGEVFRTYGPSSTATYWRLYRGTDEVGRLFANLSGGGFNVQAAIGTGSLWLRNQVGNGLRVIADGSATINGQSVTKLGFVGVGSENTMNSTPGLPWSRLHLVHDANGSQTVNFRNWMLNGMLMTGNNDLMYIGQRFRGSNDATDAVFFWSDNSGSGQSPDRLRFVFGTNYSSGASAGSTTHLDGLEIMRLHPSGFIGMGDYLTAATEPTERLDLLTGNLRIRALPGTSSTSDTKVLVVDNNGVVHWRPDTDVAGVADCDWVVTSGSGAGTNHVYTAVGAATNDCPDGTEAVGIGTSTPTAKLDVVTDQFTEALHVENTMSTSSLTGIAVEVDGGTSTNTGVDVIATQAATFSDNRGVNVTAVGNGGNHNHGVRVDVTGTSYRTRGVEAFTDGADWTSYAGYFISNDAATWACGVEARSTAGGSQSTGVMGWSEEAEAGVNIGVVGKATGEEDKDYYGVQGVAHSTDIDAHVVGVYGTATGAGTDVWAIWSEGEQYSSTGTAWTTSDAMFKTNVQDLNDGLTKILQLEPKTFYFDTMTYGHMKFSGRLHNGLLAQDVATVVPELIRDVKRPADLDSAGSVVNAELQFKAIQYMELIPLLISAVKQQQTQITQLQQEVTACCNGGSGMVPQNGSASEDQRNTLNSIDAKEELDRKLTIQPNPFVDRTNLAYTLDRSGQMLLVVTTPSGRQVQVLREGMAQAGTYSFEWETSSLSSGMYYVTLLLDGEVVTKKAVKL